MYFKKDTLEVEMCVNLGLGEEYLHPDYRVIDDDEEEEAKGEEGKEEEKEKDNAKTKKNFFKMNKNKKK